MLLMTSLSELIIRPHERQDWGNPAEGAATLPQADNTGELTRAFTKESWLKFKKCAFFWHVYSSET